MRRIGFHSQICLHPTPLPVTRKLRGEWNERGLSEPKIPEVGSAQFLRFVDAWSREVEGSLPRANLLCVGGRKEPRATGGSWIRPRDEQALHRRSE